MTGISQPGQMRFKLPIHLITSTRSMVQALAVVAIISLVAAGTVSAQGTGESADRWTVAEKAIVRLPPAAFAQLPKSLVAHLTRIGCSVPQSYLGKKPHNVIKGRFRRPDQTDWAVLCHRNGITSLLVFWGGAPDKSEEIRKSEDRGYLQVVDGDGTISYSHAIGVAGKASIRKYHEAYGGPTPPEPLDHEGIDDAFLDKASTVLYWHNGGWLELWGAD